MNEPEKRNPLSGNISLTELVAAAQRIHDDPSGPVGKIRVKTCHIAVLVKFLAQLHSEFSIVMVPGPETMGTA
jgi:hypothetical protein